MPIVDTAHPVTSERCDRMIQQITQKYPFCRSEILTRTAFQRPVRTLVIGNGPRKVIYTGAIHANEWITALVLLKFAEELAQAIAEDKQIWQESGRRIAEQATIYMIPMVNPDGVDLVTGAIAPDSVQYELARQLADNYPNIPFPEGWKANLIGVDLNLNFPAGWLRAREIKFSQGFIRPGPRDYVGRSPLSQVETQALTGYTDFLDPALILAYHSQGKEIYWQFGGTEVEGARELGEKMAAASGYTLTDPPVNSSYAGYKDWFIQEFIRPGYTVEVGQGVNPLPLSQFDEIYRDNLGILVLGATGG